MQKVVDFLEKNVQWLVLGLAGLVFLLMVWTYVVQPPVTVTTAGKQLLPGEIDQATVEGPVANFKRAVSPQETKIEIQAPPYEPEFRANANPAEIDYTQLVHLVPGVKPPLARIDPSGSQMPQQEPPSRQVTELVVADAAKFTAGNNGRSVIMMEDPKVKARRKPGDPAPTVKQADMVKQDKDWVTVGYEVDVVKLGESFKKVFGDIENLPPNIYETQIVYVELVREEKLPNGQWGNRKSVRPLPIHDQPPFPDGKDMQKVLEYAEWVAQHPDLVTQPPFYEVSETGGDLWAPPGTEVTAVVAPAPAPAAATPKQPARQQRPYGGYPGGYGMPRGGYGVPPYGGYGAGGAGRGGRRPNYALQDDDRPVMLASGMAPYRGGYPGGYGGYPGGYGGYPGMGRYPGMGGYPGMGAYPGMAQAGPAQVAAQPGSFNVTAVNQPISVWAHDDTVEAGKTYRYAIHYYIRNPLFQTLNLAKDKALSQQYAIKSQLSDWSDQVKVTPKVNFFLAGLGKDKVKFEVFTWQAGAWKKKTIERAPGDLIADTTWTLVDLRRDGNENYVLLVNQGGTIQRRDFSSDRKTPLYQQLNGEAENAKAATAAALR